MGYPTNGDPDMDMNIDAALIRNERLKRAWSQEHLAQVTGLGLRTVHRIENGGNASLETIKALAAVLELPVEALLTEAPVQPEATIAAPLTPAPRFSLFRPWRTFGAGFLASVVTMGGFVAMQLAVADQVDMDFTVRLDNEEITRSRVVGETGTPAIVEVSEVMRISVTPTIMEGGAIFLKTELYLFKDGEYKLESSPAVVAMNGREAMIRSGYATEVTKDCETCKMNIVGFKGFEIEITPMIE
jgi:transcriptional regulator with XRE-family HTH domain